MDPVSRRKFLASAALGGAAVAGVGRVGFLGRQFSGQAGAADDARLVSATSSVDTSQFPKGPKGLLSAPLLDVDETVRTITVDVNNPAISTALTLDIPEGTEVIRETTGRDLSDLMLGDLLSIGIEYPEDYSWVSVDYICANVMSGLAQVASVGSDAQTVEGSWMYGSKMSQDMTNWASRNVTVSITPSTVIVAPNDSALADFSTFNVGDIYHFTSSADRPNAQVVSGLKVEQLLPPPQAVTA